MAPNWKDHPQGNYRYLPGISPYSCGVAAKPGYEIVHATFHEPRPYRAGFDLITEHLKAAGQARTGLCAIELRCPRPYTFAGFAAFNREYAAILESWGVFVDGVNPVARTNVAPAVHPPDEPVLYGFSYSRPSDVSGPTFVVAGAGELPEGVLEPEGIVAAGDISPAGIARKAAFVMDLMENRLRGLGGGWPDVTAIDVYTIHPYERVLSETILARVGSAAAHGVRWYFSRPPVEGIEFEMDLRGVRTEVRVR